MGSFHAKESFESGRFKRVSRANRGVFGPTNTTNPPINTCLSALSGTSLTSIAEKRAFDQGAENKHTAPGPFTKFEDGTQRTQSTPSSMRYVEGWPLNNRCLEEETVEQDLTNKDVAALQQCLFDREACIEPSKARELANALPGITKKSTGASHA